MRKGEYMSEIKISGLTFGYERNSEDLFKNVSFSIDTDWKLGFIGRNGNRKRPAEFIFCYDSTIVKKKNML